MLLSEKAEDKFKNKLKTNLSNEAIKDLRVALRTSYGDNFDCDFSDEEISEIGEVLLAILAGSLKIKMLSHKDCLGIKSSEIIENGINFATSGYDKN